MYNTILVPTDLSHEELTIQALIKAKDLSNNDRIILLHVLDQIPSYILAGLPDDVIIDAVPKIHKKLNSLSERAGVEAKTEIRNGGELPAAQ